MWLTEWRWIWFSCWLSKCLSVLSEQTECPLSLLTFNHVLLSYFHLSFYLSSPLSFPLISSSGCLWAPGRVCPSWACTSVSCTVRPVPSAAWQEIPTAPGTDTPAAPTCPPYGGRGDKLHLFIQTTLIWLFGISLTSWIFFPLNSSGKTHENNLL